MSFNSVVFLEELVVLTLIPLGLTSEQDNAYKVVELMSRLVVEFMSRQSKSNNLHLPGTMMKY